MSGPALPSFLTCGYVRGMPLRLDPDLPLADAARTAVQAELDHAMERLDGPLSDTDVHEIRKHGKRIRAVMRLLRPAMGRARTRRLSRPVRDGARHLAPLRDARVMRDLLQDFDAAVARSAREHLPDLPPPEHREGARHAARAGYAEGQAQLDGLPWESVDREALREGLSLRWQAAARGWQAARTHDDAEVFHDWRKDIKALGYQVKLLRPIWPDTLPALADPLSALGDHLGQHHDAAVLADLLRRTGHDDRALLDRLARRESALLPPIHDLGRELFARAPAWTRASGEAAGSGTPTRVW